MDFRTAMAPIFASKERREIPANPEQNQMLSPSRYALREQRIPDAV